MGYAVSWQGEPKNFITQLTRRMKEAAADMDFERAAVLRDDITALTKAFERNAVVLSDSVDADLFRLCSGRARGIGTGVFRARWAYSRTTWLDC